SNEENEHDDYMASLGQAQAQALEDDVNEGGGGGGGGGGAGGAAAGSGNNESGLGGQTMPQISPNAPLEGNVSPTPTQTHFEDNRPHSGIGGINSGSNKHIGNGNGSIGIGTEPNSNRSSPAKSPKRPISSSFRIHNAAYDEDEDLAAGDQGAPVAVAGEPGGGGRQVPDYWQQRNGTAGTAVTGGLASGRQSRAISPSYLDNMSENSEQPPVVPLVRSKSRPEISSAAASRYSNLSYWKARRVVFYRNGDPFFPGVELRYRPGRDVTSLDNLLDKISPKMDLPRGARYVFSMDGDRKYHLDELEDGAFYVVSSFKAFKVS
ncbi:hypothetical protein KR018_003176, partial [Drosophila ironensis]